MENDWLNEVDEYGETPLTRVSRSGRMDLANVLFLQRIEDALKEVAQAPEIHRAAYWGYAEALQSLISGGDDPDLVDQHGERPLHKACRHGHHEAAETLLENGADPNAVNSLGLTPLHWAVMRGMPGIVELLLEHGADWHVRDWVTGGLTPRDYARLMRYTEVAEVFDRFAAKL